MAQESAPEIAMGKQNSARQRWLAVAFSVGAAAVLTWLTFLIVGRLPDTSYISALLTQRGYFQHINVALFWWGLALVVTAMLRCWHEAGASSAADEMFSSLIGEWDEQIRQKQTVAGSELIRRQRDQGDAILQRISAAGTEGAKARHVNGILLGRVRRIGLYLRQTRAQNVAEMMDLNRDLSALDDERLTGQFSFVRYIVYLMPVIGFLGTVWGIGGALGSISEALPNISDLKGFINSLGGATLSLQVAFDTTLLALILGGLLTLFLTLGSVQSSGLLGRIDTWIIDNVLSHVTEHNPLEQVLSSGFAQMIGRDNGGLYHGGLSQINTSISESRDATKNLDKVIGEIKSAMDRWASQSAERGGALVSQTKRAADTADAIHTSQAGAAKDVKSLTNAVGKLPDLANTFDSAASKLANLAEQLSAIGKMTDDVRKAVDCLAKINDATGDVHAALAKKVKGSDGSTQLVDTISAIMQMRDALAEQMAKTSKANAEQISSSLDTVAAAHKLIAASNAGLHEAFLDLRQAILKVAKGS